MNAVTRKRSTTWITAGGLAVASLVVVAGAGSAPVASKGIRRAKKHALGASSAVGGNVGKPAVSASGAPPVGVDSSNGNGNGNGNGGALAVIAPPSPTTLTAVATKLVIGSGTRVLVFGDSFTDAGFSQRIKQLVTERGGKVWSDGWTSATTKLWATKDRLDNLLAVAKPDVVIIVLGANEVFLSAPEKMGPYVKQIVGKIAGKSCAWVSPPLWKGENGIVSVTKTWSSPSCSFFDSGALKLDKQADGIHPTLKGGTQWADIFWATMVAPAPAPAPTP